MNFMLRTVMMAGMVWSAMLFSGYGMLIGSHENIAGLGLQCQYLSAKKVVSAQFIHSGSGFIGLPDCPVIHKVANR